MGALAFFTVVAAMCALRAAATTNPLLVERKFQPGDPAAVLRNLLGRHSFLVKLFGPADAKELIELAGRPKGLTPETYDAVRFAALGVSIIMVFASFLGEYWALAFILTPKLPDWWLNFQVAERRRKMKREFLTVASRLSAAQAGGLSLEKSLEWTASGMNKKYALRDELNVCIAKARIGLPFEQIFDGLAERTGVPDVRRLAIAVLQARKYGVSIVESLQTAVSDARIRRRAEIIGQAKAAEQKMQLALFIMATPSIILTLAPMIITQMQTGGGLL